MPGFRFGLRLGLRNKPVTGTATANALTSKTGVPLTSKTGVILTRKVT